MFQINQTSEKSLLLQAKHIFRHHAENYTNSCGRLNKYVFVCHISLLHCVLPLLLIGPSLPCIPLKRTHHPLFSLPGIKCLELCRLPSNFWPTSLFFLLLCRPRQPNWVQLMGWSAWHVIHLVRSAVAFLLFWTVFTISQMLLKAPFTRKSHYYDMIDPEAKETIKRPWWID